MSQESEALEEIIRNTAIPDWITLLIFLCLAFVAAAKLINTSRFNEFIQLIITNKYFLVHGKNPQIFIPFNILLLLVQIISASLFLFIFLVFFREDISLQNQIVYIQILGFYTLFIGLKFYIEKIIATLFSIEKHIDTYLYQKLSYRNLIALLLLVFNMILLYTTTPSTSILIAMVAIIVLFNIISLVYSCKVQEKLVRSHFFYFILYLCALEISPYFILYKILVG
ncbi:MAG: DUF4271 domain-containing protein [Flavobacteriaceae bacterium]